jgi:hypothetical protein
MRFLCDIDLSKCELKGARVENLSQPPPFPAAGQIYFDTAQKRLFVFDGDGWAACSGGGVGSGGFEFPQYDGAHAFYGDQSKGYMVIGSGGTLTALSDMVVDIYLVGGGGSGRTGTNGNGGGGGGYTKNIYARSIPKGAEVSVVIGAGGTAPTATGNGAGGGYSQFGGMVQDRAGGGAGGSLNGGAGGSGGGAGGGAAGVGGDGGSDGGNGADSTGAGTRSGGAGQGTTTRPFEGDTAPFDTMQFAGGGGGGVGGAQYAAGMGGAGGGANAGAFASRGFDGAANTGGGGGGGSGSSGTAMAGGNGGDGVCIIRWGY